MKYCNWCKIEKSIEEFAKYKDYGRGSYRKKEYKERIRNKCRKCTSESAKLHRDKDRKKYNKTATIYNLKRKDKISEYNKSYRKINKDRNRLRRKKYTEDNKKILQNKNTEYVKNRLKVDKLFKLKFNTRTKLRSIIINGGYKKSNRSIDIIGCSYESLLIHIESKFEFWMTWENHGLYNGELNYGWDIDHITPTSSAKTEEDLIKLLHYSNLQPLCSKINRDIKRDIVGFNLTTSS